MSYSKEELAERLLKTGIEPSVLADLLWPHYQKKIAQAATQYSAKRAEILASVLSGLAVNLAGSPAQHIAEIAERITDAVMREEEKRGQS